MTLSYDDIYSYFLGSVTSYDFLSVNPTELNELFVEYLHKTLAQPYVRRLFSSITIDDEIMTLTFEMSYPLSDESADLDFVVNILSKGMVVAWLEPQVRSQKYINQMFGTKETKFFAQANHLDQIRGLLEDTKLDMKKQIRDRGYIYNDYLGNS